MSVPHRRSERAATLAPQHKPGARWGSVFFTVIAVVGSLHAMFMLTRESALFVYTNQEVTRLAADISELQNEIRTLQAVIEHKNDLGFRGQLARLQGFIYPDETRILTRRP
jgi:cell division protein FtsL